MRKLVFLFVSTLILAISAPVISDAAVIVPGNSSGIVPTGEPDPNTVKAAIEEFRSLSRKAKKERLKNLKKEIKAWKKAKREGDAEVTTLLLVIIAIILPPLAVYLHQGEINTKFWIALILSLLVFFTLFLWIIPVVYALLVVLGVI